MKASCVCAPITTCKSSPPSNNSTNADLPRYFEREQFPMAKPKRLTRITPFRWIANPVFRTRDGKTQLFEHDGRNRVGPEKLIDAQRTGLEQLLNRTLYRHEWSTIEKVRTGYVRDRHTLAEALTEAEIKKYFADFVKAANGLLLACGKSSPRREAAAYEIWNELTAVGGLEEMVKRNRYVQEVRMPTIEKMCNIPVSFVVYAKMLESIVARGETAQIRYLQKRKGIHLDTFNRLIGSLKYIFETGGAPATAAKSSRAKNPRPSAFVLFVWTFMHTLPREIREHVHSVSAMEKAVSAELKLWRRHGAQNGRTDYYLY
jgi:hypothetical protein